MKNRELIEKELQGTGFKIGGFSDDMERLNIANLKKVIDNMTYSSTDIDVRINRKAYVVEVNHVDDEIDFGVITKAEYISRYGNERYEED